MPLLLLLVVVMSLLAPLPYQWTQAALRRHGERRADIPFTGAQMAMRLLQEQGLDDTVIVEASSLGDHYAPGRRIVRLAPDRMDHKSLAAVVVAAHEVGHAMQHREGNRWLLVRHELAVWTDALERIGSVAFMVLPLAFVVVRTPAIFFAAFALVVISRLLTVVSTVVTLPMELDASFGKAMPMLRERDFLSPTDLAHAEELLRAAAYTYVAAAVSNILNPAQWIGALLRR